MQALISRITALTLLLVNLCLSGSLWAQPIDDCMSAHYNNALALCQNLIDNGRRSPDVYWKLSSSLYQSGKTEQANKTLDTALRLFPSDTRLKSLEELIATSTSEQAMIARSAKLNQNSLDKGAMKISCLTKTGNVGISACKRRLELSNQDGERIRTRLAELETAQQANRLAIAPIQPTIDSSDTALSQLQETPQPDPFSESNTREEDAQRLLAEARRQTYQTLVADVQTRLNAFGFNAGSPDGVPGNNTRRALSNFYRATGVTPSSAISDLTLENLENEKLKLSLANEQLQESQQALANGDRDTALSKLQNAQEISGLLSVPAQLALALRAPAPTNDNDTDVTTLANNQPSLPTTPAIQPQPSTDQQQADNTGSLTSLNDNNSDARFVELIGQINVLQGRIQRQQNDQSQQLASIRDAL